MRVLLTSIGSFGDLNPYIGLGLALKRRGHDPVLAVANAYRSHVEAAGLECRPVGPHGDPADLEMVDRVMHPLRGAEYLVRDLLMPRLDEAYHDLFEVTADVDALVSLLREDAVLSMPPRALWLRGADTIRTWWSGDGSGCRGTGLVPTAANGAPAYALYKPTPDGGFAAFGIQVVDVVANRIAALHTFIEPDLVARFGLPMVRSSSV